MIDLLPSSLLKEPKGRVFRGGVPWIPFYCANCGVLYGYVPEADTRCATWYCQKVECEKAAIQSGKALTPDAAFWERWHAAVLERFNRPITEAEFQQVTTDVDDPLSKLAREF